MLGARLDEAMMYFGGKEMLMGLDGMYYMRWQHVCSAQCV
jgi:hypothetical protein